MSTIVSPAPASTTVSPASREQAGWRARLSPILLGCGILAAMLYLAGDILLSAGYQGYSYLHQSISELNAIGAPTRGLSIVLGLAEYALVGAFGVGIWLSAVGSRRLRVVGGLLVFMGVSSLWGLPFASMQPRGAQQDVSHAVSGILGTLVLVMAMGFAASASARRFRLYSIVTIVVMLAFGGWAAMDAGRIEQGLATPWVGVKERIMFYSWHLWYVMLALTLLRRRPAARAERGVGEELPTTVSTTTGGAASRP